MGHKNRIHTLCSHLGSGACFKLPCYSLGLFSVFPLYTSPYSSMLHLNPCGTKDPREGAAGAGAADAVEQPPQNEAEQHGKTNDKGADEVQRDRDEQPRENRGDEEVKSEEKEEEEKKDEAAGRPPEHAGTGLGKLGSCQRGNWPHSFHWSDPNMSNYLVPNPYPWAFLMFCQN